MPAIPTIPAYWPSIPFDQDIKFNIQTIQITVNNIPYTFKLPTKADKVYNYFLADKEKHKRRGHKITPSMLENLRAQSNRTAWKLLSDWIEIQVSLIKLEQVETIEIFLSYLYDPKTNQTLFEKAKETNFKLLEA